MRILHMIFCIFLLLAAGLAGCRSMVTPAPDRLASIPVSAVKVTPLTDEHPPLSLSPEYGDPVPVPGDVNTAGGEDSPFITPDGTTLYFWFTPDVHLPAESQVGDGVTGIYVANNITGEWKNIARINLQEPGKSALDGCAFVAGDVLWFCSAREGYSGIHWFTAESIDGRWQNLQVMNFDPSFQVGELHISMDGRDLYFASDRQGGQGGLDIWVSHISNGVWNAPEPVASVNTASDEGWPALSPDGSQLWFSRDYGLWRSLKTEDGWAAPVEMIAPLAGEPSIDQNGNIYFVHHFFHGDVMLEADVYVALKIK
jgi:hypothetical protein